ncbi:MAG: aminoacyl-tRNA hydrolase [Rhizobiales bacterium]|nr:aminoacyl-tRNA hydrolase [Hyphomicrobiales bacterium]
MFLIVGLGNPGAQYADNRHNIGFMAVDAIHRRHDFPAFRKKFRGEISEGTLVGVKTLLLKPATFMNESGRSVQEVCSFYKIDPPDIVVIHDELDLAPGKVRLKTGGGSGGHNGIKSMDAHIGTAYRRVRLGIGHPGDKALVSNYVLSDFAKADAVWLEPLLEAVALSCDTLARGEDVNFTTKLALKLNSNEPPGARGQTNRAAGHENKPQSHIRQARSQSPAPSRKAMPTTGPMADILKKLFGGKDKGNDT